MSSQSSVVSVISEPGSSVQSDLFTDEEITAQAYHMLITQDISMEQGLHGCAESSSAHKRDSAGNIRPTLQVNGRTVGAHVLAMAHHRMESGQGNWDSSLVVSRLCRNSRCVRAEHLLLETAEVQAERTRCVILECAGCSVAFSTCQHRPECLLAPQYTMCKSCKAVFDD